MTTTDTTRDDNAAQQLRATLVADLVAGGHLSPAWRPAFAQIPRHHFLPRVFARRDDRLHVPLDSEHDRDQWLQHVYTNQLCVTQLDGDDSLWDAAVTDGTVEGIQTCTSTEPSLMASMLNDLDIHDDHTVLEIGTGTGYNAGLLCHRLGDHQVTSVDVDSGLVDQARRRLAALGYHPTLATADGRDGYHPAAPYDRIIATCSVPQVPYSWVKQTSPGGQIIVNLGGLLGGAMLLLAVHDDGTATGRFQARWAGFLPARPSLPGVDEIIPKDTQHGEYVTGHTHLAPEVLDDPAFAFLAWVATADARPYWAIGDDGRSLSCLIGLDGSWAEVSPPDGSGKRTVEQGGPRRLRRIVEDAYQLWETHQRPGWSKYEITINSHEQTIRLPAAAAAWRL